MKAYIEERHFRSVERAPCLIGKRRPTICAFTFYVKIKHLPRNMSSDFFVNDGRFFFHFHSGYT